MEQLTPWEAKRIHRQVAVPGPRATRIPFGGNAGYLCGGIGSLITFALLFRPWLTASGYDGRAKVNAFGQIHATTSYLNIWSQSGPALARISGIWALLAVGAITVAVFASLRTLRGRRGGRANVAAASTVAMAGLVLIDVLYLNSKGPQLKAMVGLGPDWQSQVGLVVRALTHRGRYPLPGDSSPYATAGLTSSAIAAAVIAILSAAAAVSQWKANGTNPEAAAKTPPA